MCVGEGCWWWMNGRGRVGGEGAIQQGGCWKMSSEKVSWVICSSLTITLVWKWTSPPPHLVSCNLVHVGENACRGKQFYFSDRLDICIDLSPICSKVWIEMLWSQFRKIWKISPYLWSACMFPWFFDKENWDKRQKTHNRSSKVVFLFFPSLSSYVENNWGSNI